MSDALPDRLAALDTATLHEAQGRTGAVDPAVKAVWPAPRVSGRAYTVRCHPGDNLAIHRAVAQAQPGDVLVVDAGGHLAGYWGEILTVAAQVRGIRGLVIDGGCRDVDGIESRAFGVWARGVYVQGCTKHAVGWIGEPISCGGALVHTGDYVVADRDGVVIVAADTLGSTVEAAERRIAKERDMMERLGQGELTLDLMGLRSALPPSEGH